MSQVLEGFLSIKSKALKLLGCYLALNVRMPCVGLDRDLKCPFDDLSNQIHHLRT